MDRLYPLASKPEAHFFLFIGSCQFEYERGFTSSMAVPILKPAANIAEFEEASLVPQHPCATSGSHLATSVLATVKSSTEPSASPPTSEPFTVTSCTTGLSTSSPAPSSTEVMPIHNWANGDDADVEDYPAEWYVGAGMPVPPSAPSSAPSSQAPALAHSASAARPSSPTPSSVPSLVDETSESD